MFSKYLYALLLTFNGMLCASAEDTKPLLHPLFTDHAVLQRDARVPVWGWAKPGTKIMVMFACLHYGTCVESSINHQ